MAETPQGCEKHQKDYAPKAWEAYTLEELGKWVHLFAKRSQHRTNFAKKDKDLLDAQNYLDMMQSVLNDLKEIRLEKFAPAFCRELEKNVEFKSHSMPNKISIGYASFFVPDDVKVSKYADFWGLYVLPLTKSFVNVLKAEQPVELVRIPMHHINDPVGCVTFVGDKLPIRGVTSYHTDYDGKYKGTKYRFEIAFADKHDDEYGLTPEEFYTNYQHHP